MGTGAKRQEEERRIAEEHKRRAELVPELIENWEEAARLRGFVKAIEEEPVRSGFSEVQKNDIQQVADWTGEYADSLDPLCDLLEAMRSSFVPRANTGGWSEFALRAQHLSGFERIYPVLPVVHY
jgi:hypothetical protein